MNQLCRRVTLVILVCAVASAQAPVVGRAFEVVSIKPGSTESLFALIQSGKMHFRIDEARVDLGNVSLMTLIGFAYGVPRTGLRRRAGRGMCASTF